MKKYILLLAVIFFSILCSGCLQREPELSDLDKIIQRGYLIVGVKEDSPPFGYYKDGKLTGIDIDIAKNIANNIFQSESPDNIKFVKVNPQNKIAKLNSEEVDIVVAAMSINEKRKLVINFSKPYFIANQKLMVLKNSKIAHIQYFNTSGRLGVILGTTGERTVRLAAPTARITGARSYKEAVNLLLAGQIDGIVGDDCILQAYITDKTKLLGRAYSHELYAVATRKSDKSAELLDEVNIAIAAMIDEKKIKNFRKTIK